MTAPVVQDNLFSERLDCFLDRAQDDHEQAKAKSLELLRAILPENMWPELAEKDVIRCTGKRGTYVISPYYQTEILNAAGRCVAYACLQLSILAPRYDRMIAEYLLIRNDEDFYWKTANIFRRTQGGHEFGVGALLVIAFDIALFVNLVLEVVAVR